MDRNYTKGNKDFRDSSHYVTVISDCHQLPNNCLGTYSVNSDLAIHTETLLFPSCATAFRRYS